MTIRILTFEKGGEDKREKEGSHGKVASASSSDRHGQKKSKQLDAHTEKERKSRLLL